MLHKRKFKKNKLTYFVWIPRYKYKLWHTSITTTSSEDEIKEHGIEIIFESKETEKSNGTQDGEWLTHPSFTFGSDELSGIWVGKFETGYNGKNSTPEIEPNKVLSKANLNSWVSLNLHNAFYTLQGMNEPGNVFGLAKDSDVHVMKNTEWGAVAYLSHSEYGTCTNGVCEQVYVNNSWYTGCGGDTVNEGNSERNCKNGFGTKEDGIYNQTTNKNISGIFDMNGRSYEQVMARGYSNDEDKYADDSGFTAETYPEAKYVDEYEGAYGSAYFQKRILGDATAEIRFTGGSWYNSSLYFGGAWHVRGGGGFFNTYVSGGDIGGFRIVLV